MRSVQPCFDFEFAFTEGGRSIEEVLGKSSLNPMDQR